MPYYPIVGWFPFMGFFCLIFILAIACFICMMTKCKKNFTSSKSAEDLLAERYAKGELTREEYTQMKEDIRATT